MTEDYSCIWGNALFPFRNAQSIFEYHTLDELLSNGATLATSIFTDSQIDDEYIINYVSVNLRNHCVVTDFNNETKFAFWEINKYTDLDVVVDECYDKLIHNLRLIRENLEGHSRTLFNALAENPANWNSNGVFTVRTVVYPEEIKKLNAARTFDKASLYFNKMAIKYVTPRYKSAILEEIKLKAIPSDYANPSLTVTRLTKYDVAHEDSRRYIAFNNIILDSETGEVIKNEDVDQTARKFTTVHIPRTYLGRRKIETPIWNKHLCDVFTDNKNPEVISNPGEVAYRRNVCVDRFKKWIAYSLTRDNKLNLFAILYGRGCNGKSFTMNYIEYLFADECVPVTASGFLTSHEGAGCNGLFLSQTRRIGRVNEFNSQDGTKSLYNSRLLKTLTGNEKTNEVRTMYCNPVEILPSVKFYFLSNSFPSFDTTSTDLAFRRRMLCFPFAHTFPNDDEEGRKLMEGLKSEADAVMTELINILIDYRETGVLFDSESPAFMLEAAQSCVEGEYGVENFIQTYITPNEKNVVKMSEIYDEYCKYCHEFGIQTGGKMEEVRCNNVGPCFGDKKLVLSPQTQKQIKESLIAEGITLKRVNNCWCAYMDWHDRPWPVLGAGGA